MPEVRVFKRGFLHLPCRNCGHPGHYHASSFFNGELHMIPCMCGCDNYRGPRLAWLRRALNWWVGIGD